ncbi:cellulose-binding protein [Streptomyces sp. NPDC047049]|uniref:cellulose-binding protein n=1 Tax=Streptomyces sp. NPDC047049 TaxID=3156688 RepID=UPI0033EE883A
MSASVSPHGFEAVRGRGYRPDDVDRRVTGLSVDRDSCWERAARLTVLHNQMEAELAELRAYLAQQPPQTYESLGSEARLILTTAESEAARLRAEAEQAAERMRGEAAVHADDVRDAAERAAHELRAEADTRARRTERAARGEATELAAVAAEDAERLRSEAAEGLAEVRRRTAQLLSDQEQRQTDEWDAAGRELAELEAETDRCVAELDARGKALRADARRLYAEAEETARHRQEDGEDRAAGLLAHARAEEERIERATERILRQHDAEREEVRVHMTHVRNSLAVLTGKAPAAEGGDEGAGSTTEGGGRNEGAGAAVGCGIGSGPGSDEDDTLETQVPRRRGGPGA